MSDPAVVQSGPAEPQLDTEGSWSRARRVGILAYLFARLCVVAAAAAVSTVQLKSAQLATDPSKPIPRDASKGIFAVLNSWDGQWYYRIIREGYPRHVVAHVTFSEPLHTARAAFFPLYPLTVRALNGILPGGDVFTALTFNFVMGLLAVLLVGVLARRLYGVAVAERAMVLMAVFPGSFVLSFAYSEALMFVLVALCLIALLDERWVWAGVLAALVTAARPNGLAICFACAAAALISIRQRRDYKALIAPVLSPIGWATFQVLLSRHADERGVWFRVQREAWHEGISFGLSAWRGIVNAVAHPFSSPAAWLTLASVAAMAVMVYASLKKRLPVPILAYCFVVLALMLLPSTVTARPRFLYTAFPLLIGVAAWWPPKWQRAWSFVLAASGAGLVLLTVLYGGFTAIP